MSRGEGASLAGVVAIPLLVGALVLSAPFGSPQPETIRAAEATQIEGPVDTVRVPWPVAEGGVRYRVEVDGELWSAHATIHAALREAGRARLLDPGSDVYVEQEQRYRIEERAELIPIPEPIVDSATVFPRELELQIGERAQVAIVGWIKGRPYACVLFDGVRGGLEVSIEEEGEETRISALPGGDWIQGLCYDDEPVAAELSGLLVTAGPIHDHSER